MIDIPSPPTPTVRGAANQGTASFTLDPGETITCEYRNEQVATVDVTKTEGGAAPSEREWTFTLEGNGVNLTGSTVLAGRGQPRDLHEPAARHLHAVRDGHPGRLVHEPG